MKDNLEKFITSNRDAFDLYEPSPEIWKRIEKSVHKKSITLRVVLWRAAAVILIFGASFVFQRYLQMVKKPEISKIEIPELQEAEIYYTTMVSSKLNEIEPLLKEHPGMEKEIMKDLSELDVMYSDLKKDLVDNVANQEVIEAMIQNYRMRLDILEDVLNELKNQEKNEKNTNEVNL